MLRMLPLALADLADARVLAILVRSLLVTMIIFAGLGVVGWWALAGTDPCALLSDDGTCALGPSWSGFGAILLTLLAAWLLFPAIALGVISAYSDRIVGTIEAKHYPAAFANARPPGVTGALLLGLRSTGRLVFYNLVAMPLYLLLLVTGVGPVILFVLVNGIAIGRDVGEMVVVRHARGQARTTWLRRTRLDRAAIGIVAAGLFLIPIVNLVAPILAAAMTTHLFHMRRISPTAAG